MNKDVIGGTILLAVAGAYYWATRQIPDSSLSDEVGAQGLPLILAVLLAGLAALIIARSLVTGPKQAAVIAADDDDQVDATPARALWFFAFGASYVILSPLLGYAPAIALLIAAVALYEGMSPSWRLAAVAVGGAAAFWLLFVELLGVEQPSGPLF
jgi:hypothetical protein